MVALLLGKEWVYFEKGGSVSCRYAFAVLAFTSLTGISQAQSSEPSWFTQNYHLAGPPPPGEATPANPANDIQIIQETLMNILRKTNFAGDYEAALYAAWQAAENAQLLGAVTAPPKQLQIRPPAPAPGEARPTSVIYLIAFKDQTIHPASTYWMDGNILHFITPQGAHEQVRLDLVDINFSVELNRQMNLEFRLPQPNR